MKYSSLACKVWLIEGVGNYLDNHQPKGPNTADPASGKITGVMTEILSRPLSLSTGEEQGQSLNLKDRR